MKIKVLVLGDARNFQHYKELLRDEEINIVGEVSDTNTALEKIDDTLADMVLITDTEPVFIRACEQIYLLRPRTIPVALADKQEPDKVKEITRTGVHRILPINTESKLLIRELKGIYASETNRMRFIEGSSAYANKSKVILMFGTKGGVGKTTLAVNLALELAQNRNKVCIVDYNFQFGNVGCMLGINNLNTISELLEEDANPNIDMIRQFLSLHSSGINALLAPNNPEDSANITASQADRIISTLRVYYDYVIIDTPPIIDDILAISLDSASMVLFVTNSDVVSLKNSKKGLMLLEALGDFQKIRLVVNGMDSQINLADIEKVFGVPIWQSLPSDFKMALDSANQGRPFVGRHPDSKLSKGIKEMVVKIDGDTVKAEKKKGGFLRFRKASKSRSK
ncbi:MAG TPA: AAA family ATPase [Clostridia bacterium]|nr:AAA family ATPase [Clostridia bacterium]